MPHPDLAVVTGGIQLFGQVCNPASGGPGRPRQDAYLQP